MTTQEKQKVILCWSGGKDSALALFEVLRQEQHEVVCLLTTVADEYHRVSHHGVREVLLDAQARSTGIPLHIVRVSRDCTNAEYESTMEQTLRPYRERGVRHVVFGDLFLEDLRQYRDANLAKLDMVGVYPLWKRNTQDVAAAFLQEGFQAIIVCVDGRSLNRTFAGRTFDRHLLNDLPEDVDPCGENGEFHSFAFDGPLFRHRVDFRKGKIVNRDQRFFCDLVPETDSICL